MEKVKVTFKGKNVNFKGYTSLSVVARMLAFMVQENFNNPPKYHSKEKQR